jgi:hypothetical protein
LVVYLCSWLHFLLVLISYFTESGKYHFLLSFRFLPISLSLSVCSIDQETLNPFVPFFGTRFPLLRDSARIFWWRKLKPLCICLWQLIIPPSETPLYSHQVHIDIQDERKYSSRGLGQISKGGIACGILTYQSCL